LPPPPGAATVAGVLDGPKPPKRPVPKEHCTSGQFAFDGGAFSLGDHEVWAVCANPACGNPRCGPTRGDERVFRVRSSRDLARHLSPALKSVTGRTLAFLGAPGGPLAAKDPADVEQRIKELGGTLVADVSSAGVVVFAQGSRLDDAAFLEEHVSGLDEERASQALEEYGIAERLVREGKTSLVSPAELHACLYGATEVLVAPKGWLRGRPSAAQVSGEEGVARNRHLRRDAPPKDTPLEWPENDSDVFARGSIDYHQSRRLTKFTVSAEASRDMEELCRAHPPRFVPASPSSPGENLWTMPEQLVVRDHRLMEAEARRFGSYHVLRSVTGIVKPQPDGSTTSASLAVRVTSRRLALREEAAQCAQAAEDMDHRFALLADVPIVAGKNLAGLGAEPGTSVAGRLHAAPALTAHATVRAVARLFGLSLSATSPSPEEMVFVQDVLPGLVDDLLAGAAFASGSRELALSDDAAAALRRDGGLPPKKVGDYVPGWEALERFGPDWLVPADATPQEKTEIRRRLSHHETKAVAVLRHDWRSNPMEEAHAARLANEFRTAKGLPRVEFSASVPAYEKVETVSGTVYVTDEVTLTAVHPKFPGLYVRMIGTVGGAAPHPVTGEPSRTFTLRTLVTKSRTDRAGFGGRLAAEVAGTTREERRTRALADEERRAAARAKKRRKEEDARKEKREKRRGKTEE